MRRIVTTFCTVTLLAGAAFVGQAHAQKANVPGIIGGAIEGDVGGAAGAAMGYDYYSPSGNYYPGSQTRYGNPYYNQYYGNRSYGPGYQNGAYWDRGNRYYYPNNRTEYRTGYRAAPANPPADAEPYRAVIVNPEENQAMLTFSLNGQWHQLKSGDQMELSGRMPREIRFDRGNGQDVARYKLAQGKYTFTPTKKGWELYRTALEPADTAQTQPAVKQPGPSEPVQQQTGQNGAASELPENPQPQP